MKTEVETDAWVKRLATSHPKHPALERCGAFQALFAVKAQASLGLRSGWILGESRTSSLIAVTGYFLPSSSTAEHRD